MKETWYGKQDRIQREQMLENQRLLRTLITGGEPPEANVSVTSTGNGESTRCEALPRRNEQGAPLAATAATFSP